MTGQRPRRAICAARRQTNIAPDPVRQISCRKRPTPFPPDRKRVAQHRCKNDTGAELSNKPTHCVVRAAAFVNVQYLHGH